MELANYLRIEAEFCKQEENKIISIVNVVESSQPKKRNYNKIHDTTTPPPSVGPAFVRPGEIRM